MIDRNAARVVVEEFLRTGEQSVHRKVVSRQIATVRTHAETEGRPPIIYQARWDWAKVWIAYLEPARRRIGSAEIVIVSGEGEVLYAGSANDEG
jgi:hypothetical protein